MIVTSGDVEIDDQGTDAYYSIRSFVDKDSSGAMTAAGRTLVDLDYIGASSFAGRIAKESMNPEQGTPGKYDIIFEPLPFADLLNTVGSGSCSINA